MARPFISHDGVDPQGRRAEVVVEVHTGIVKGIEEMDKVAKVVFAGDGLSRPVHGYIQLDDPVLDIIREAKKSKETVEYRIEIVRKPGVDRSTPMAKLREDTETAQANVRKLLAGINGHLTKEAVTNPAEDAGGNGIYKATDPQPAVNGSGSSQPSISPEQALTSLEAAVKAGVPHEAISAMVASSILAGVEPEKVLEVAYPQGNNAPNTVHQTRSREEPIYRRFNTDGTLNLGSSQVIAGVSSENFARRILQPISGSDKNFTETVEKIASIVLAIADTIQVESYGNTGHADRMAGSHTRIRGVIYDIIENTYLPPVLNEGCTDEDIFQWVVNVGKMTRERFKSAITISESKFDFSSLRPAASNNAVVKNVEEAPVKAQEAPAKVEAPAKAEEAPAAKVEEAPAPTVEEPESVVGDEDELEDFELFEITAIEQPNPKVPSTAVVNKLKKMITQFDVPNEDFGKIGSLLEYSFGVHLAKEVPSDKLVEFINFYTEHGKENLHAALRNIDDLLGK